MKIAIIGSRGMGANYGGIEKVLSEICPRLVGHGHEVHVYGEAINGLPNTTIIDGVKIIRVGCIPGKYTETLTRTCFSLARAIFKDYDVINLVAMGPGMFSPVPRLMRKPTLVSIHGLDGKRDKWPWFAKAMLQSAERMISVSSHEITVVSQQLKTYFSKVYGRDVVHIPNGLNVRDEPADTLMLDQLDLKPNEYVLFASRLVGEKGAHELIEAFREIDTSKTLVIAGGARYDRNYVESLYRAAGKSDRIKFTGHVTGPLLDALFAGAYLYVLPSHMEGLSLSLLEAVGYGKACLVSDIPENLEVIGDYGFTFPVGDVGAMRDSLQQLLDDENLVADMAAAVRGHAARQYAWDNLALQYSDIYEALGRRRTIFGRPRVPHHPLRGNGMDGGHDISRLPDSA